MGRYKGRYGLSDRSVCTLYESHWRQKKLNLESGWDSFDAFVRWASETGYVKRARLRRANEGKPYGPENAFWDYPVTVNHGYPSGHPCKGCEQDDDCSIPCDIRLQYWDATMKKIRINLGVESNE